MMVDKTIILERVFCKKKRTKVHDEMSICKIDGNKYFMVAKKKRERVHDEINM